MTEVTFHSLLILNQKACNCRNIFTHWQVDSALCLWLMFLQMVSHTPVELLSQHFKKEHKKIQFYAPQFRNSSNFRLIAAGASTLADQPCKADNPSSAPLQTWSRQNICSSKMPDHSHNNSTVLWTSFHQLKDCVNSCLLENPQTGSQHWAAFIQVHQVAPWKKWIPRTSCGNMSLRSKIASKQQLYLCAVPG